MILVWTLLVGVGSYRLWRLLAEDQITESLRARWLENDVGWITGMVGCAWCLGSWVTFAVTWATDLAVGLDAPVLVGLAAAVVTGWLGEQI